MMDKKQCIYYVGILGTLTDETANFFITKTRCRGSLEDTFYFCTFDIGSPYNKFKVYALMGGSSREDL